MQVLFDTDIVLELAGLDLLSNVCETLGVNPSEVCVPPSSIFKLRRDKKGKLASAYGAEGLARAISFLEDARSCEVDPALLQDLNMFAARADVEGLGRVDIRRARVASTPRARTPDSCAPS
ncbi:MAG: hypothetical protein AAFU51_13755, partial [Bacteroidota bacterium]